MVTSIRTLVGFALLGLVCAGDGVASTELLLEQGRGKVDFEAVGNPSALRIRGNTSAMQGKLFSSAQGMTGTIEVSLSTLDTGIKMRNEHMIKRYLEADKFPKGELSITRVGELKDGAKLEAATLPFEGQFTLHGVARPVKGEVILRAIDGTSLPFEAKFAVHLKDFAIKTPSFAGITVADEVSVEVKAMATLPVAGKTTL